MVEHTWCTEIEFVKTNCLMKWKLVSMCLDLCLMAGLEVIKMDELLSHIIDGVLCIMSPQYLHMYFVHWTYDTVEVRALYSTSALDLKTVVYFLDIQVVKFRTKNMQALVVHFLVFKSPAKSTSQKAWISEELDL